MKPKEILEEIDNFFDSITLEEFDLILEKNGIKNIKSSNECDMQLMLESESIKLKGISNKGSVNNDY